MAKKKKLRDRRLFLHVKCLGICDPHGKNTSLGLEYRRLVGDSVKPLSTTFLPILEDALQICSWKSIEDKMIDLRLLQRYVNELVAQEVREDAKNAKTRSVPTDS